VLSTFAETFITPPPLSVENEDCEKALIPNIISSVHYQKAMQTMQLFLSQQPKRTF
jgi:hypothetical protein